MQKILLTILALALCATAATARQPERGYRGFFEWNFDLGSERNYLGRRNTAFYTGASTSHGCQVSPYVFVGAGMNLELCPEYDRTICAFYADARYDAIFGRFTPFGDLRLGYAASGGGGVYFSPVVGYRFNWGRKVGINISAGMTMRSRDRDLYQYSIDTDGIIQIRPTGTGKAVECCFALRLGIDY